MSNFPDFAYTIPDRKLFTLYHKDTYFKIMLVKFPESNKTLSLQVRDEFGKLVGSIQESSDNPIITNGFINDDLIVLTIKMPYSEYFSCSVYNFENGLTDSIYFHTCLFTCDPNGLFYSYYNNRIRVRKAGSLRATEVTHDFPETNAPPFITDGQCLYIRRCMSFVTIRDMFRICYDYECGDKLIFLLYDINGEHTEINLPTDENHNRIYRKKSDLFLRVDEVMSPSLGFVESCLKVNGIITPSLGFDDSSVGVEIREGEYGGLINKGSVVSITRVSNEGDGVYVVKRND